MKKLLIILLIAFTIVCFMGLSKTSATIAFIETLNKKQLNKLLMPLDDTSRKEWHYLPAASWPRHGLKIGSLNSIQEKAFFNMLKSFLSSSGLNKTKDIIQLENVLVELGGNPARRDAGAYYFSIFGNPKTDSVWAWSFEGHHLSLNFTVSKNVLSTTPRFFGANPGTVPSGTKKGNRVLQREEDLGFELLNSFSDIQKKEVIFSAKASSDILTRNAIEVTPLQPIGIKASALSYKQKELLKRLLKEYLSALSKTEAEKREQKILEEEFDAITFAWAGAKKKGIGHYYRIQGNSFLIEFDNTQNNANHIHTVWRDFNGDFGKDLIKAHLHNALHHHKEH